MVIKWDRTFEGILSNHLTNVFDTDSSKDSKRDEKRVQKCSCLVLWFPEYLSQHDHCDIILAGGFWELSKKQICSSSGWTYNPFNIIIITCRALLSNRKWLLGYSFKPLLSSTSSKFQNISFAYLDFIIHFHIWIPHSFLCIPNNMHIRKTSTQNSTKCNCERAVCVNMLICCFWKYKSGRIIES